MAYQGWLGFDIRRSAARATHNASALQIAVQEVVRRESQDGKKGRIYLVFRDMLNRVFDK